MPRDPALLPESLRSQPFLLAEARAVGVADSRLRRGDLRREFRGVVVPKTVHLDLAGRCRAYLLDKRPEWVISGVTAALLHGIPLPASLERERKLHVLAVRTGNAPRSRDVVGTHTEIDPRICRVDGVRALAPEYAWAMLEPFIGKDEALIVAGERLWDPFEPLATVDAVDEMLRALARWKGAARLGLVRARMREGSHSPRETRLRLLLDRHGIPTGVPNARIVTSRGGVYYGDLVVEEYRVIFEYDGDQHREDDGQWNTDVRRLNDLAADDWLVVRYTKHDEDAVIVRAAIAALRSRGWRPAQ